MAKTLLLRELRSREVYGGITGGLRSRFNYVNNVFMVELFVIFRLIVCY